LTIPAVGSILDNTFAFGVLAWKKECFDQLAFTTDNHSWKSLVPFALGDLGLCIKPARQQFKLRGGDFTILNALKEVLEERGRKMVATNPGHGS
jgi:hypothetical protein